MWEVLMMLRLLASLGAPLPIGRSAKPPVPPASTFPESTFRGAIRLSFAAYRLSLPILAISNTENHDQKIA
ncbi:hypothetical protein EOD23_22750 [Mesorhizobium sp. USDA-HM6]|nr:hypothetical protein EOD23_22750 [Mesorhizobium sp. USDA-HM6]